jgi:peptide deformylase
MKLKLRIYPDPILSQKSEVVKVVDDEVRSALNAMADFVKARKNAVGLSGVQVGILKRLCVVDLDYWMEVDNKAQIKHAPKGDILKMINPEIIEASKEVDTIEEACLSIPFIGCPVTRPWKVKVKFLDENGVEQIMEADSYLAKCFQHEIDHLNGTVILDHVSRMKRDMLVKKMQKHMKAHQECCDGDMHHHEDM